VHTSFELFPHLHALKSDGRAQYSPYVNARPAENVSVEDTQILIRNGQEILWDFCSFACGFGVFCTIFRRVAKLFIPASPKKYDFVLIGGMFLLLYSSSILFFHSSPLARRTTLSVLANR